jgi:hypothetical protein
VLVLKKKNVAYPKGIPFTCQEQMMGYVKSSHETLSKKFPDQKEAILLDFRICLTYHWSERTDSVIRNLGIREDLLATILDRIVESEPIFQLRMDYGRSVKTKDDTFIPYRIIHSHDDLDLTNRAPPIQLIVDREERQFEIVLDHAYMDGQGAEQLLTNLAYMYISMRLSQVICSMQRRESMLNWAFDYLAITPKSDELLKLHSKTQAEFFSQDTVDNTIQNLLSCVPPCQFSPRFICITHPL